MTFNRGNLTPGPRGLPSRWRRSRNFNILVLIALLVSATLLGLTLLQRDSGGASGPGELGGEPVATIAMFDVGQALSAAVITGDGASLLYDFGLTRADAEDVVIPFLENHNVTEIDYAVLSHPHQDHVGGLPALLDAMAIATYIDPVLETTNQTYLQSLQMIEGLEIDTRVARQGDQYSLGDLAQFDILWPVDELLTDADGGHRLNDNSTVLRVVIGDVGLLLTGDIERDAEEILVETLGEGLEADILQIAHHGSNTSSQASFLNASDPDIAVIPVGADNQYGHPHTEVVQRLRQHEIDIYRTDVDGTVIIQTDGEAYDVTTTRTGQSWNMTRSLLRWTVSSRTTAAMPLGSWYSTIHSN